MSFRDTFTRSQTSSSNLQYDDTAAYHFYTTILIIVFIPISYSIIKTLKNPFGYIPKLESIEKKPQFVKKIAKFKKQNRYNYLTCFFVFKMILMILIIVALIHCFFVLQETGSSMKGFDPYEILEIDPDTPIEKIKKSYRKLALKYHPDRNPGDPQANAKFIMISKAYECLTDSEAKQNCLKFGNPEGTSSFNVGIALPSFLVHKQNQVVIMGAVFLLVVIILPIFLIYYFGEVNKYDDFGMLQESHPFIHSLLNQQLSIKDCIKVMSLCTEFKNLKITRGQSAKLDELYKQTDEEMKKVFLKKKYHNYIKKSMVLIDARVTEKKMPLELMDDFRFMLKKMPVLIKAAVMLAASRSSEMVARYQPQNYVGANAIHSLITFGQFYIQGKHLESEPFQQLDLTDEQIDRISKKKKKRNLTSVQNLKNNPEDNKFFLQLIGQPRANLMKQCLDYMPTITSLEIIAQVPGETDITTMDIIEIIISIESQRPSNFCNAPKYPFLKLEGWYIIVEQKNYLINLDHFSFEKTEKIYEKIENEDEEVEDKDRKVIGEKSTHEFKFNIRAPPQKGSHSFSVYVMSDCYFGIDAVGTCKYEVKQHKESKQTEVVHQHKEEDESFFTRVMKSMMPAEEEQLSDKED